jgi:hypothetical protein
MRAYIATAFVAGLIVGGLCSLGAAALAVIR